jgi:hypothetical protein
MVPAVISQFGSTLDIVADPGTSTTPKTVLLQVDTVDPFRLDVIANGLLTQFAIPSINHVNVQVAGNDLIEVNDGFGFPFAPGTNLSLFGSGANNQLSIVGSRAISGSESFVAGTSTQIGSLSLAGSTFHFSGAITNVADEVPDATPLIVLTTAGPNPYVTGSDGVTETITGLGGGNNLIFSNKATVELQTEGSDQIVALSASAAARGLRSFYVVQTGTNDATQVDTTPSTGGTSSFVSTNISDYGQQEQVIVLANAGLLNIYGNASTTVNLGGSGALPSLSVTSGIDGLVSVQNVGALNIYDGGNATTQEKVTLTPTSITGTGLFGPNGSVQYSSSLLGGLKPQIYTGQLHETYTVTAPNTSSFDAQGLYDKIEDDSTTGGLSVIVDVTAFTDLDLDLVSKAPAASSLFIAAPPDTYYNPFILTSPSGFVGVAPLGALHTTYISYTGFDTVGHSPVL